MTEAKPQHSNNPDARLKAFLRREAVALGFTQLRVCRADDFESRHEALKAFTDKGYHGTMDWLKETHDRRAHPTGLWGEARSILMLSFNYGPESDPRPLLEQKDRANISVYARNRDYHDVMKGRLKQLASKLISRMRDRVPDTAVKVFVDTAPLMEKPLAALAGLGWQGKHTNLVSRDFGSWLFLGAIVTNLDLVPDEAESDHCGSCRACLDACPTRAFPAPYRIDASRCISYLSIEHKGPVPHRLRHAMGNRIYGCDDCLAACPWNKFAQEAHEARLIARDDLLAPPLADFLGLDDTAFRTHFSGSPIKRIGRNRFLRNVLIAAGNSSKPELAKEVIPHLTDPDPIVRGQAIWAFARLGAPDAFIEQARTLGAAEEDAYVRDEWARGHERIRKRGEQDASQSQSLSVIEVKRTMP